MVGQPPTRPLLALLGMAYSWVGHSDHVKKMWFHGGRCALANDGNDGQRRGTIHGVILFFNLLFHGFVFLHDLSYFCFSIIFVFFETINIFKYIFFCLKNTYICSLIWISLNSFTVIM